MLRVSAADESTRRSGAADTDAPRTGWSLGRLLLVVVGLVVSAFFLYVATRQVSVAEVRASFADADYVWLIPTLILLFTALWVRAARWRLLFTDPSSVTYWQSAGALSIGFMFNIVLPSRAGEIPRMIALRRATGVSVFEIAATIIVERILDVFVIAVLGLALSPWFPDRQWLDFLALLCAVVVLGSIVLIAFLAVFRHQLPHVLLRCLRVLPFVSEPRAHATVGAVVAGSRILLQPRKLIAALALTCLAWGVTGLLCLTLLPAFGFEWDSQAPWLILVANTFALAVPSAPAALGVYEASVQAPLVALGTPAGPALSYAIALHAVNFFPVVLTGIVAAWLMARRPSAAERHGVS
jgi:uncharacterized protein (TIRG00374 family)